MGKPFMVRSFDRLTTHHERLCSNDIPEISCRFGKSTFLGVENRINGSNGEIDEKGEKHSGICYNPSAWG